mmetsp:Transcript_6473/g.7228  ORF Transcript_6473/g.7228 Transcript_6473/m.7228 type:complete len:365 (+) Transcript_6473:771-1865(+)
MIDIQLEVGNRWAYISTFLKGRTENQVKNRFKTLLKKHILGTYGKSFYDNYMKEVAGRDEHDYPWKSDQIVLSLLELKKNERDNMQGQIIPNGNLQMIDGDKTANNTNMAENHAIGALSAFQKVSSNFAAYSRNSNAMNTMNSQPVYLNHSLDYIQDGKNLNYESINLNNSMRSFNSVNSGADQQNMSMNSYTMNKNQNIGSLNPQSTKEEIKQDRRKPLKNTESMVKSTIPRTFIDLGAEMVNNGTTKQDTASVGASDNAQMDIPVTLKNNSENKNGGNDDVNMDSTSNNNFNMNFQPMMSIPEISLIDVKQMAVRKFIDSENEENLYIMQDGSMVVECIKTSQIKMLSHSAELTIPLRSYMN